MAQAKRRLTNIRVKEVSLVDEAANLRRFIVVKRKGGNGMGKKNAELLKDDDNQVEKLSSEVKETLVNRGNEVIEKMKSLLEDVEKIEVAKNGGDEVPGTLIEKFEEIAKAMPQFKIEEDSDDFGIAKAADEIKKAGKKISANRLEKIKDAFSILSGLLEEFNDDNGGGVAKKKDISESTTGHDGGNNMAGSNETEAKKRSPGVAFTIAEAEVLKVREALELAESSADAKAIEKAQESLKTAEADLKVAKEAKDEADKAAEVAKAKEEADKALAALAKAKGESDPEPDNADVLKQILAGQKLAQEKLDAVTAENAELKKKLEEVSKTTQPSNSATDDGADDDVETKKTANQSIEKGKAGSEFWGNIF